VKDTHQIPEPADCRTFREFVFHFQADELSQADRSRLQAHVDGCDCCARYLEVEDGFLRGLRARLAAPPPPPGLEARLRGSLSSLAGSRGGGARPAGPFWASLAAALLLAALLVVGFSPGTGDDLSPAVPVPVIQEAVVVDLVCDEAGASFERQRRCRHPKHVNALKLPDGTYWAVLLEGEVCRKLVLDPQERGRRLVVEGFYYPAIRTVELVAVRDAERASGSPVAVEPFLATLR
jgi:hypothetical protein